MEMNAANVAQHKIFPVKPSFVDNKKWMKKADLASYPRKKYKKLWINEVWITVNSVQL